MGIERVATVTWTITCDECGLSTTGPKATELDVRAAASAAGFEFPLGDRPRGFYCAICKKPKAPPPPTDWNACTTLHGTPLGQETELQPDGMQKDYVVLTAEERAKGFVRPVRRAYKHDKCGAVTTMGLALCETYAREPRFYSGTFCATCREHFPVGPEGEFTWVEDGERVGT